jgi:hypothetical protein
MKTRNRKPSPKHDLTGFAQSTINRATDLEVERLELELDNMRVPATANWTSANCIVGCKDPEHFKRLVIAGSLHVASAKAFTFTHSDTGGSMCVVYAMPIQSLHDARKRLEDERLRGRQQRAARNFSPVHNILTATHAAQASRHGEARPALHVVSSRQATR